MPTIQGRGRWRAGESVRVYEKHGSLLRQRAKLRGEVVVAARAVSLLTVRKALLNTCSTPFPPTRRNS
eukprot:4176967-Lingulodinium_polyedra.AAC.1